MKKLVVALVVAAFAVAPLTQAGEGCCKAQAAAAEKPACCPAQASCPINKDVAVKADCPVKQKQKTTAKKANSTAKGGQLVSAK